MEEDKLAQMAHADESAGASPNGNGGGQDDQSTSSEADEKALLAAEVETLRNEKRELEDKTLRLVAEMENLRRRTERDKAEFSKYAISEFARELLSVGDNLRRAIESVQVEAADNPAVRTLLEGVEVTERELMKAFEKHQIKRFDPQGEPFNPHLHDAMTRIDVPNVAADTVVQVVQSGYMIAERVLRPAAVIVAKGGTSTDVAVPNKEVEDPNRLPPGATKVPEEVQAEQEMAAEGEFASMPKAANRVEGRAASGREFQVERKRPSAPPGGLDERVSQIRRQPPPRPAGSVEAPRNQQPASKPSTLHKPVINSGNE